MLPKPRENASQSPAFALSLSQCVLESKGGRGMSGKGEWWAKHPPPHQVGRVEGVPAVALEGGGCED